MSHDGIRSFTISVGTEGSFSNSGAISFSNGGDHVARSSNSQVWFEHSPVSFFSNQKANFAANAIANGALSLQRIYVVAPIYATRMDFYMHITGSASGAASLSIVMGIYTLSGSTASLASSASRGISFNSTSAQSYTVHSGTRMHSIGLGTMTLSQGEYMIGMVVATSSASTNSTLTIYGGSSLSLNAATTAGGNNTFYWQDGVFNAATSSMPSSIHLSDINITGNMARRQPYFQLAGTL